MASQNFIKIISRIKASLVAAWKSLLLALKKITLNRLADVFGTFRKILSNLLLLFVLVILTIFVFSRLGEKSILIQPFEVPAELEKMGYNGRVFAAILMDQLKFIEQKAPTSKERGEFSGAWLKVSLEDIKIPEAGISLESMLEFMKDVFNIRQTQITGEAVLQGDELRVTARVSGAQGKSFSGSVNSFDSLQASMFQAAMYICRLTQPYILANFFYKIEKSDSCLELLNYCLRDNNPENDPWAYNLKGIVFQDSAMQMNHESGKEYLLRQAVFNYERATGFEPRLALPYYNWGNLLQSSGKHEEAIAKYKKAVDLDENFVDAYYNWGVALQKIGEMAGREGEKEKFFHQAAAKYRQTLALAPEYAQAVNSLGVLAQNQGKLDEAREKYEQAISLNPDYERAYNNLGALLQNSGEGELAMEMYRKAVELDSLYGDAYYNWGIALKEKDLFDPAIDKLNQAIKHHTEYIGEAYKNLGNLWFKKENYSRAIEMYKKALDRDPDDAYTYYRLGINTYFIGDYRQAIQYFENAIRHNLEKEYLDDLYNNLGISWYQVQNYDSTLVMFERAVKLNPRDTLALNNWESLLDSRFNRGQAIARYEKNIINANGPAAASVPDYYFLAQVLWRDGNDDRARENFRKVIDLDGGGIFAERAKRFIPGIKSDGRNSRKWMKPGKSESLQV